MVAMGTIASTTQRRGEERVIVTGVTWQEYEAFLSLLTDHPGVRLYYLEGELEIMTTSPEHERTKSMLARLVEHYAFVAQVDLRAYGSTTFRKKAAARGAEPDECYVLSRKLGKAPDIVIEVVITHGGLDKLAIYRGLGVAEVWFFEAGRLSVHRLRDRGYKQVERSGFVPELDLALLEKYAGREDQLDALTEFDREIRVRGA
jgi:Uma2 family endonuclease